MTLLLLFLVDKHVKILECLRDSKKTVNIQYLQLCFIGPPFVGKTTMRNHLLKVPMEARNSPVPSYDQTLTFVKKDKWQSLKGEEGAQAVVQFLRENIMPKEVPGCKMTTVNPQSSTVAVLPTHETLAIQETIQPSNKLQMDSVIDRLKAVIKCSDLSKFGDLIGSILFNVHDFGGRSCFLEMLPALIHGPALYLICFNMSEGFDNRSIQKQSTKVTISRILSSIASIRCIPSEPSSLEIGNKPEFYEKFKEFKNISPNSCVNWYSQG